MIQERGIIRINKAGLALAERHITDRTVLERQSWANPLADIINQEEYPRINDATKFMLKAHAGQVRKGPRDPYSHHPLRVTTAVIEDYLAIDGWDEDVFIASLLHDTVEDTIVTLPIIEYQFGIRVRDIVEELTEPENTDWNEKKINAVENVRYLSTPALIIRARDQEDNWNDTIKAYKKRGETMFLDFNADRDQQLMYASSMAYAFLARADELPHWNLIRQTHQNLQGFFAGLPKST